MVRGGVGGFGEDFKILRSKCASLRDRPRDLLFGSRWPALACIFIQRLRLRFESPPRNCGTNPASRSLLPAFTVTPQRCLREFPKRANERYMLLEKEWKRRSQHTRVSTIRTEMRQKIWRVKGKKKTTTTTRR